MASSIDSRLMRVLIALAENNELTARERMQAAMQLAEFKASKPRKTAPTKNKKPGILG